MKSKNVVRKRNVNKKIIGIMILLALVIVAIIGIKAYAETTEEVTERKIANEESLVRMSAQLSRGESTRRKVEISTLEDELEKYAGRGATTVSEISEEKLLVTFSKSENEYEIIINTGEIIKKEKVEGIPPSTLEGLQVGDFVNYDAGTWKAEEIAKIKTGLASSPVTANNSTSLPSTAFQFGGFTVGSSRNGNATPYNTTYNYVKDASTGEAVTGWRIFDIDGDNVTLISAGNPEDYYHAYGTNYGYISEYILTGNVNSSWTSADTSLYAKRDWNDYVNKEQKAESATVLTKSKLDAWYAKYTDAGASANTYRDATFQKIYAEPYIKYQSMVENYSYYWLSAARYSHSVYGVNPNYRLVDYSNDDAFGVRVLVSLSSEVLFAEERAGTITLTGGNMNSYGGDQTFNVWNIQ